MSRLTLFPSTNLGRFRALSALLLLEILPVFLRRSALIGHETNSTFVNGPSETGHYLRPPNMSTPDPTDQNPRFFDLVGNVRAMRRLEPDPVPDELLEKVLEAGVQAPSGMNLQPWAFVVLREAEGKRWFAERYRAAMETRFAGLFEIDDRDDSAMARQSRAVRYQVEHLHETPILLLVCGERDWPFKVPQEQRVGLAPPNYGAVYPCVQNILLACRAVGLGAALTTMHQVFEDELHERFAIPTSHGVVVTIPIGFPKGRFGPVRRRPASSVTYYERWGVVTPGTAVREQREEADD